MRKRLITPLNLLIGAGILLRILLAVRIGIWFPAAQTYDDALLIRYGDLAEHFSSPSADSLLKYIGYPVFLFLTSATKIPYPIWLSALWILGAFLAMSLAKRFPVKKFFPVCVFFYILFLPCAFEAWCGTRLYRNAILAPFTLISLCLMLFTVINSLNPDCGTSKKLRSAILTGIVTSFTYYVKEDGIWLLACLLFFLLLALGVHLIRSRKEGIKIRQLLLNILILFLPVFIWAGVTQGYKAVNLSCFGVSETNTRTDGELGAFVQKIYSIQSDDRSDVIWSPTDAIEKAFNASATLSEDYPQLWESLKKSPWCDGDLYAYPLHGDYLTWALREALVDSGVWESEKQVSDLFAKVNEELDLAFADGTLQKDTRITLLPSAGGKTVTEIWNLKGIVARSFAGAVLLKGYTPGGRVVGADEIADNQEVCETASRLTSLRYVTDYSKRGAAVNSGNRIVSVLFKIYSVVNGISFLILLIVLLTGCVRFLRNIRRPIRYIKAHSTGTVCFCGCVLFGGIAFAYAFGIAWFSSFLFAAAVNMTTLNFYSIAMPVLLFFAYLFAYAAAGAFRLPLLARIIGAPSRGLSEQPSRSRQSE